MTTLVVILCAMSGILYEEEDDARADSRVEDVAELERILEESEQESQHSDSEPDEALHQRPHSAMSILQRHGDSGSHRKKSIHWMDEAAHIPAAAPTPSPSPTAAPLAESAAAASVSNFRRCLKLLGLQPHEFGVKEEPSEQPAPRRRAARAPVSTRLRTRSVSLEDLRAAARDGRLTPDVLKDGDVYKMISSAVYEEWYFRKQREEQERRRRQQEEERSRAEELERKKAEIKRRSQEKFEEWLQHKTKQLKQTKSNNKGLAPAPPLRALHALPMPERAERAFQDWKRAKDQQQRAKQQQQVEAPGGRKGQLDVHTKEDAAKAYAMWKKRAEELQRKDALEKKKKEEVELVQKQKKEDEKKEMSRKSFDHWKTVKDEEQRKAEDKARRRQARAEALEAERKEQRQYEARQAFLAWLDQVDERQQQQHREPQRAGSRTPPLFSFRPARARRNSCFT